MVSASVVGVIGGSGFYSLLDDAEQLRVPTPYGEPSDPITLGRLGERQVAFVPRHARDHRFAPHAVPYRANIWALRSLGVRQVVSLSAVGSLLPTLPTGTLVAASLWSSTARASPPAPSRWSSSHTAGRSSA